jgi:hypothetical protein
MMMSFICSCRNKNEPKAIYPKGTSHHTRLFRGPSTNDMKKWDGPSRSWPTPHTTPFFLPPEDPSPVLLRPNSIPEGREEPSPQTVPAPADKNWT